MKRIFNIFVLLTFAKISFAEGEIKLNLDDLAPPSAPALAILGVSPSEIQRPTSAKAFATNILNDAVRSDGSLASDVSMQFAPYWWASHEDLTFEKYNGYNDKTKEYSGSSSLSSVFLQSLSVSLALSTVTSVSSTNDVLGSLGLSFDLLRGRPSKKQLKIRNEIVALSSDVAERLNWLDKELFPHKKGETRDTVCEPKPEDPRCKQYESRKKDLEDETKVVELNRAAIKKFRSERRVGQRLQFAIASANYMKDGKTSERENARSSAWFTYSYIEEAYDCDDERNQCGASPIELLALLKWNENELESLGSIEDAYDIGGRIIWEPEHLAIKGSIEYLKRFSNSDAVDGDDRIVAQFDYEINNETAVVFSIGKNFESNLVPSISGEDVVAIIAFKFAGGGAFEKIIK